MKKIRSTQSMKESCQLADGSDVPVPIILGRDYIVKSGMEIFPWDRAYGFHFRPGETWKWDEKPIKIVYPLNQLKRKNAVFIWGDVHQAAFDRLKKALCSAPVLRLPDFSKPFVLQCDASDLAIAAVLNQDIGGELAPIAYASRKLTPLENKYPIYERECLAVIFGCEKFRSFLEHKEFVVHTDSEALSYQRNHPRQLWRIGRWILRLAPFKFNIVHISGKDNVVADCLSRVFQEEPAREEESSIPMGFNSAYHEATKSTPAELFLGRSLNHPLQLQWKLKLEQPKSQAELEAQWRDAIHNLRDASRKTAVRYNAIRQPHKFLMGDRVRLQFYERRLVCGNQFGLRIQYHRLQQLTGCRSGHPF
ncbi:hypothetical protein ANN_18880 [Periplaneta americana]|uniref:Reverse transcriptase/retrotransposon-derived protein RNase H-like domain-containing protein n=1 Tax=Periplaneta americana TaxID=6978 RepID=A0ABQ8SR17_PERAM|nr:hypothetical protein ANN_18880 [Periplaneta americana]